MYVGIERPNGVKQDIEEEIIAAAKQFSIPITVFHMSRYVQKEDAFAYEVLNAMDQSLKMTDRNRLKPTDDSFHVLTEEEWSELVFGCSGMA